MYYAYVLSDSYSGFEYEIKDIGDEKKMRESDYVCVLELDTEINDYDGLNKVFDYLDQNKDVGILGPKLSDSTGRNIPSKKVKIYKVLPINAFRRKALKLEHRNYDKIDGDFVVGYVTSECVILRYDNFKKIEYFDEKIFFAPEDVEYCVKSWDKGLKDIYFRDFSVLHHWQRISIKNFFSKFNFEHLRGLGNFYHKYKNLKEIRKAIESYEKN